MGCSIVQSGVTFVADVGDLVRRNHGGWTHFLVGGLVLAEILGEVEANISDFDLPQNRAPC